MKVLAINGSPKTHGNTAFALELVLQEIRNEGIDAELITIGQKDIRGCIGCGQCGEKKNGRCCAFDDTVNALLPKLVEADGIVLGSPVYFAGINGTLKAFLDRAFFVSWVNGGLLRLKVGAGVVALRRSGGSTAFDQLNKYFMISEMTTVGSCYWNIIHGFSPGESEQDPEGGRIMKTLGRNMAWLLKLRQRAGDQVALPESVEPAMTNFVR